MKIVFFGTADFGIPTLQKILESKHEVLCVITAPDKPKGRGLLLEPSPIKKYAIEKNLRVLQPEKLKDEVFINQLKSLNPDLGIVVAFRILPVEVYSIPKLGTFNLHASLLPKYRGPAPIQWCLMNGENETGVTTFFLKEKVDTGNIILQEKVLIEEEDNFEILFNRLSLIGAELVNKTIERIENGNYETLPQDESLATLAPKITKEVCKIDWNQTALKIHNQIRALSPIPGAFTIIDNKVLKIFKSKVTDIISTKDFGTIEINNNSLLVNTKDKLLSILELQLESRKKMTVQEFLRGYRSLLEAKKFSS